MFNLSLRICIFAVAVILARSALATTPTMGANIGVVVARKMFAAPPLPNLDGGGVTVSAQYGFVEAKSKLSVVASDGSAIASSGGLSGNTGGIGVSIPTNGDFGYFIFGIGNKLKGETIVTQGGAESYRISNIEADTFAGAGGLSYRWIGTETSTFALAPFIGPYYMQINTTSEFVPASGFGDGSPTYFTINPTMFGLFEGIQFVFRFGPLRVNPYILGSQDMSNLCRDVQAEGPNTNYACSDGTQGKMDLDGTMIGAGLILGLGPLRINVISIIPENEDVEVTHYSGSLSYEF